MIEIVLKEYLEEHLNVPVLLEKPKNKPSSYVLIHGIDVGRTNHIDASTITFTSIAPTLYTAKVLSDNVKSLLYDSIQLPTISSANIGGQRGGANAAQSAYEYELIFNFHYYEEE